MTNLTMHFIITTISLIISAQNDYLQFFEHTDTAIDFDILLSCDDCSSFEISFPTEFPFGGYFHRSLYVSNVTVGS